MDEKLDFRAHLAAALNPVPPSGDCLSEKTLAAHLRGTLSAADREILESHLVNCSACRHCLLELKDFLAPLREGEEALPRRALKQDWRLVWSRVGGPDSASRKSHWLWTRLSPAASFLIVVALSLGWAITTRRSDEENRKLRRQVDTFQQQLTELRLPQMNSALRDVYSVQSLRRSTGLSPENRIDVPRGTPLTLILNGHGHDSSPDSSITILDSQNRQLWQADHLLRNSDGNFVITLPTAFLNDGRYTFRISAATLSGYRPVLDYVVLLHTAGK